MLEFLFNKIAGLMACNLISTSFQKKLQHRFLPSLLNHVSWVVKWITWTVCVKFLCRSRGLRGSKYFWRWLRGSNFFACLGQIYFCAGLCLGQNILRGSKIFAWVKFFFAWVKFLFAWVSFYLLDEIISLYYN